MMPVTHKQQTAQHNGTVRKKTAIKRWAKCQWHTNSKQHWT